MKGTPASDGSTAAASGDLGAPERVGAALGRTIRAVFEAVPACSLRPTELARTLRASRVMISRISSAVAREDPIELLTSIPGPESLRSVVRACREAGVPRGVADDALDAIGRFDGLIRDRFGTRAALDAALSVQRDDALERFERSSRYQIYKGMSQILGVEADTWLTCMMLTPSRAEPDAVDVTNIHGALGMRRLRPDVPIFFAYGSPHSMAEVADSPVDLSMDLSPFYTNAPAPLVASRRGGKIIHEFPPGELSKAATYDMLAATHAPRGSHRYASATRRRRGVAIIPDIPVTTMVCDVLVFGDIFAGVVPDLHVFNTAVRGVVDVEDQSRAHDRVMAPFRIEDLGLGGGGCPMNECPRYPGMIEALCARTGHDPAMLRTWRLRVAYPIYGFQFVISFAVPDRPAGR